MAYNPSGINQENQENWLLLKDEHPVIFEDRKCCLKIGVCIYRGRGGGGWSILRGVG